MASYIATVPFCHAPPPPLTIAGLTRALALLIDECNPLSHGAVSKTSPYHMSSRARTRRDYRRLVFQSLAEPDPAAPTTAVEESNGQHTASTEEFGQAVASLMLSFGDSSSRYITWKVFNRTLAQSMASGTSFASKPSSSTDKMKQTLNNMLNNVFSYFVQPSTDDLQCLEPLLMLLKPARVLTPPLLSQLSQFLPPTLHYGFLQLICGENRLGFSSSSITDGEVGKQIVVGAFIPTPWNVEHNTDFGSEDSSVFQLRPMQQVFRARRGHGVQHAHFFDQMLLFGGEGGCRLTLDMSSQSGNFVHSGALEVDYQSYFNDELPRIERFTIEEVEVWGLESTKRKD
ncbi:hypothetical protein MMC27_005588 [Xylographa pallens]|nr:hypothetical protein [Xylographa pallens]